MLFINAPLTFVFGLGFAWTLSNFLGGAGGALIPTILTGIVTAAVAHETWSATRDLNAEPVTTVATVRRTWSRGTLLFWFRSYYVFADKNVYEVSPLTSLHLQPGDRIEVEYLPHTRTVIRMRLVQQAPPPSRSRRDEGLNDPSFRPR
jgi:hypothetical protein